MKILRKSWTEHRTNKSIREELKVEDQWLENFTKAGVFWSFEEKRGLGKNHLGGKDRREKRKTKTEKVVEKGHTGCFPDMSQTEGGRLATDRSCFTCAVRDVTSYGDMQLEKEYILTNGWLLIKLVYMTGLAGELLKILQRSTCYGA